ncbi:MAG TPA: hypothetical protein VH880_14780 [Anaeromyxobacteraceae bacterium]|jgi:hypothetical protein
MGSTRPAVAALLLLVSAGAGAYEPTGEVSLNAGGRGTGASFDEERVVGPTVNLSLTEGGAWSGDFLGITVDLSVTPDRITGSNVDLHVEVTKGETSVRGNLFGRRVHLETGRKGVQWRMGNCSLDLGRQKSGALQGGYGCVGGSSRIPTVTGAKMRLIGRAGAQDAPYPQLVLALMAVLAG